MLDEASSKIVSHKIKTAREVAAAVGPRPRNKKVIMCHGTFDIVHPGHIRHLLYAKSKGDVLVASLTGDEHIIKANFRPFVPQELRAFNLAALEMVDYVVIDKDATPINNIGIIKPDYFAKGYEYSKDGLHPRTAVEKEAVEAYGGELLFTPGDIVYSSSGLIETQPPGIATEKLLALLQAEGFDFDGLRTALTKLAGIRVHVVGDTIVDSYTHTTLIGGMTKTPTMSVRFENRKDFVGGAGIVAKHLKAAGAVVTFSTVLGDDPHAEFALKDLEAAGVHCPCPLLTARGLRPTRTPSLRAATTCSRSIPSTIARYPSASCARSPSRSSTRRPISSCSATSGTASSTAIPFRT
jgi:rfaE bifunctional protein nucleotidyltransferase chain/domain